MNKIKVSIIVPVFNVEKYLKRCLDSLINQTLKDVEIICINDGSTDNSTFILQDYKRRDKRITVINKKHEGLSIARNVGIEFAKGEYIGFVDSDDWVDLDYFEKLYAAAKKFDFDIALADYIRVGNGKTKKRLNIASEIAVKTLQEKINITKQAKHPSSVNKIYRKKMLIDNNITFQEDVICEDKIFTLQAVYYANGIVTVPGTDYYYYRRPNSIVKQKQTKEMFEQKNASNATVLNWLKEKNADIEDGIFWAVKKEFRIFGVCIYRHSMSLRSEKIFLLGFNVLTINYGEE